MRKLLFALAMSAALSPAAKQRTIIPQSIKPGDTIAVITPASAVDSMQVVRATEKLESLGFAVKAMPHVYGRHFGSFAANDSARAADIMQAFSDPTVKAIICSRGGYGSTRLLPMLDPEAIRANAKWLVGYSDITALHAFLTNKAGVASIHGPMCGHISENELTEASTQYLLSMLTQGLASTTYSLPSSVYNKPGTASGTIVGGNLLVASGLAGTVYDTIDPAEGEDVILFIEDVGEKIYAIERFLLRLHQSGALGRVKGLIIGEFTDYKGDEDFDTMEQMIHSHLREWGYYDKADMPILFSFPAGHGDPNYPLPMGVTATLTVSHETATLTFE